MGTQDRAEHYDFLIFRNPSAPLDDLEGVARGRMKFARVAEILNLVDTEAEIVGLAIAEYLPWTVIEFAAVLNGLPLLRISEET